MVPQVDIELPEDLPLKEAHSIGETLQIKIERLPEVERAFVHLDFECDHKPEHSIVSRLPNSQPWFIFFFLFQVLRLQQTLPFLFFHDTFIILWSWYWCTCISKLSFHPYIFSFYVESMDTQPWNSKQNMNLGIPILTLSFAMLAHC